MQSLVPQVIESPDAAPDLAAEVAALESLLAERKEELTVLQEEFRAFKMRYSSVVGSRLAESAEIENQIKRAETERLWLAQADEPAAAEPIVVEALPVGKALRKLFWSVAKMFHPDHASDAEEARRRHQIMAEANRAYQEGDADSLHTLLDDTEFRSYCATAVRAEEAEIDLAAQLVSLKEELITIDFGIRRIKQDGLYQTKLTVDAEARHGRDALVQMAENIRRQITKAQHRLAHLS